MKTAKLQCSGDGNQIPTDVAPERAAPPGDGCETARRISGVSICGEEDLGSEDESEACTICFEPYSDSGDHRLASLKCGHIFGQSCIQDYLRGGQSKCPVCNTVAKKKHIRPIYALQRPGRLEREREALRVITRERQTALDELKRLKAEVKRQSLPVPAPQPARRFQRATPALPDSYHPEKMITISPAGGCRVLAYDCSNDVLVASAPLTNGTPVCAYGVKKMVAFANWEVRVELPIHSKQICCMKFSGRNDGRLLTSAQDQTLKITSLFCDTVVQTFTTNSPVLSCCWNEDDANYVYAGLANGTVLLYDTRNTSKEVLAHVREGSRPPVVAIDHVRTAQDSPSSCSGLLVGTREGCSFWMKTNSLDYEPYILPSLKGNCASLSFEPRTRHCLVSFRQEESMKHVTCKLSHVPGEDVKCIATGKFISPCKTEVTARPAIFGRPNSEDHFLIAAGHPDFGTLHVWDGTSTTRLQQLWNGSTVLDVTPFRLKNVNYLAALSETAVNLYKWHV